MTPPSDITPPAGRGPLSDHGALDACLRLGQAQALLAKDFDRGLSGAHGLSYGDFVLLTHLAGAPEGRLRRTDLAAAMGMSPSGVTRAIGPLERIGLVEREVNPRDARVAFASLTPTGRQMVTDATGTAERVAINALGRADWSADEAATLARLLAGLGATGLPGPPQNTKL